MDTRLIDRNGLVVVEGCMFPKPGETIQSPTGLRYRQDKDFSPEQRILDIGPGMPKKWYHVVVVAIIPSEHEDAIGSMVPPEIRFVADTPARSQKVGYRE